MNARDCLKHIVGIVVWGGARWGAQLPAVQVAISQSYRWRFVIQGHAPQVLMSASLEEKRPCYQM